MAACRRCRDSGERHESAGSGSVAPGTPGGREGSLRCRSGVRLGLGTAGSYGGNPLFGVEAWGHIVSGATIWWELGLSAASNVVHRGGWCGVLETVAAYTS